MTLRWSQIFIFLAASLRKMTPKDFFAEKLRFSNFRSTGSKIVVTLKPARSLADLTPGNSAVYIS